MTRPEKRFILDADEPTDRYTVQPAFFNYLAKLSSWSDIAGGNFEREFEDYYDKNYK